MRFEKPMKCENAEIEKLRFPLIVQPKIDGVRGLVVGGKLQTRTLKNFANRSAMEFFSRPEFDGLDGELWSFGSEMDRSQSLCRDTTSGMNSILGSPEIHWTIFDRIGAEFINRPYRERLNSLREYVRYLANPRIHVIESTLVNTLEALYALEDAYLADGYEGIILRDPNGSYKNGRATVREGSFLRIKRFVDSEAKVIAIIEAEENTNEAKQNALGQSERSSHSANKIPKGMLGSIIAEWNGIEITIGPGEMEHSARIHFWRNPEEIIGKLITFKYFPHGIKNLPRFPTFKSFRFD